jgi:hypothetical protein
VEFGTRRAYHFQREAIGEETFNVKMCCALAGLTTCHGPSRTATEHRALSWGVPGLRVVDPCDAMEIERVDVQETSCRTFQNDNWESCAYPQLAHGHRCEGVNCLMRIRDAPKNRGKPINRQTDGGGFTRKVDCRSPA